MTEYFYSLKNSTFISQSLYFLRDTNAEPKVCVDLLFLCPDTKPWARTGSATHSLCAVCVLEPDSWTSVSYKHPSWLIILSSVSNFNSVNNTNTQIRTPPLRVTNTPAHIPTVVKRMVTKHSVTGLWEATAPLDSLNTAPPCDWQANWLS